MAIIGYSHQLQIHYIAMIIIFTHLINTTIKNHLRANLLEQRVKTLEKNR